MREDDSRKYLIHKSEIDKDIEAFARKYSMPETQELYRQLLTSIVKLNLDKADEFDLRLINIALKELRHSFKILSKYRKVPKVTIWGSARTAPNSSEYKMAMEFARLIVEKGYMIVTGGGGGVMEAGNRAAGDKSFGVNINLPRIQPSNPYLTKGEKLIEFRYFFTRKLIFVKESNATVLFPGGLGTMDEAFEILTLFQTGKTTPRPIILINVPKSRYWKHWLDFVKKEMLKNGYIAKHDLSLFRIVNSAEEAVDEIVNYYKNYHSIRFVGHLTVLRMNKPLSESALTQLNREFADILVNGKICCSGPTREETADKDHTDLPRLIFPFNRTNYGRLNELIRKINEY